MRKLLIFGKELTQGAHYVKCTIYVGYSFIWLAFCKECISRVLICQTGCTRELVWKNAEKGRKLLPSWKGQDCFCEGEAPWQVGTGLPRAGQLCIPNKLVPTSPCFPGCQIQIVHHFSWFLILWHCVFWIFFQFSVQNRPLTFFRAVYSPENRWMWNGGYFHF